MNRWNKSVCGRTMLFGVISLLAWFGMSTTASADLHIAMQSGATLQEYFMKNFRMAIPQPDGSQLMIDCEAGEFAIVLPSAQRYWRGTVDEFLGELTSGM